MASRITRAITGLALCGPLCGCGSLLGAGSYPNVIASCQLPPAMRERAKDPVDYPTKPTSLADILDDWARDRSESKAKTDRLNAIINYEGDCNAIQHQ